MNDFMNIASPAELDADERASALDTKIRIAFYTAAAIAAVVILFGYLFNAPELINLHFFGYGPHIISALVILFLSCGGIALEYKRPRIVFATSAVAFALELYALGDFLFSAPYLDTSAEIADIVTGHVSPHASIGFCCAAMVLMFMAARPGVAGLVWAILLDISVFLIGGVVVIGHIFQVRVSLAWGGASAVSAFTGAWLLLFSWLLGRMIWERREIFEEDRAERWRQFVLVAVGGAALTTLISAVFSVLPLYRLLEDTRRQSLQLELDKRASIFNEWLAGAKLLGQTVSARPAWEVLRAVGDGRVALSEYQLLARDKTDELLRERPQVAALQRFSVAPLTLDNKPVFSSGLALNFAITPKGLGKETQVLEPVTYDGIQLIPIVTPIIGGEQTQVIGWDILYIYSREMKQLFAPLAVGKNKPEGELTLLLPTSAGTLDAFRYDQKTDSMQRSAILPAVSQAIQNQPGVRLVDTHPNNVTPSVDRMVSLIAPANAFRGYVTYQIPYRILHREENDQLLKFFLSVMLVALFGSTGVYFAVQHLLHRASVLQDQIEENVRKLSAATLEQKRMAGELDASRQEAAALFSNSPIGVAVVNAQGQVVSANPEFLMLVKHTPESLRDHTIWDMFPALSEVISSIPDLSETARGEFIAKTHEGTQFTAEIRCIPLRTSVLTGIALYVDDIEDRKHGEMLIQQSLKEKELLLQEIHHRVKNNLQVISSLLTLQTRSLRDPSVKQALRESQNRVKSIALLHDLLYQSKDLAQIPFRVYLDRLLSRLVQSMAETDAIDIELNASEQAVLNLDQAIPCGLILNELVTNSLKHAFKKGRGKIYVHFSMDDTTCRLIVSDDGDGVSDLSHLERSKSLGVRLVRTLIQQLDGDYEVRSDSGLTWSFQFPVRHSSLKAKLKEVENI